MNTLVGTTPDDVLRRAAQRSGRSLHESPAAPDDVFQPLGDLTETEVLREVLHRFGQTCMLERLGQSRPLDDPVVIGSTLLKDLAFILIRLTIDVWVRERRVLDVSLDNVLVDLTTLRPRLALRQPIVAAIEGDDLPGAILVPSEDALLELMDQWLLQDTATALINGLRSAVRVGERHLWGSFAIGAASELVHLSHDPTTRADHDRETFFGRHPELAAHLEMVTVPDGNDGQITFGVRRNCCLRLKLPDVPICINCNLLTRNECIKSLTDYEVALRHKIRTQPHPRR
jgi:hypothetical protein